ncbi:hypothetical protein CEXT_308331 [Caerostris extrusa]|uniref:Uncharacterized protein n=1 Tax=Caerostris extrusa TaxID=172846 RepID=A0AAV4T8D8_CAEEX|nr:hypothetical protein CEXT_308331 [Caerostris extrusa]
MRVSGQLDQTARRAPSASEPLPAGRQRESLGCLNTRPKSQEVVFKELGGCVLSNEDAFHPLLKGRQRAEDLSSASSRRHQVIRHLESGGSIVSTPTDYG